SSWGYQRVPLVEDRGEFSVRGGVIDVFPTLEPKPLRLELEGDRIERIRSFDPDTQRSDDVREEVVLLPVREISLRDLGAPEARRAVETRAVEVGMPRLERHALADALEHGLFFPGVEFLLPYVYPEPATLLAYLPAGTRLWIDAPAQTEAAWDAAWTAAEERAREAEEAQRFFAPAERLFVAPDELRPALAALPTVELDPLVGIAGASGRAHLQCYVLSDLVAARVAQTTPSIKPVADRLKTWLSEGRRPFLVLPGSAQRVRLQKLLEQHEVQAAIATASLPELLSARERRAPTAQIVDGALSEGFRLP